MTTLSKSQQITNTSLYMLPLVIGNLVPLVTLPIFIRFLTEEDFGAQALVTAYASVAGGVAAVGLPTAYDRNFFQYREGRQSAALLYSVVLFSILSFAVVGLGTWQFSAPLTEWLVGQVRYEDALMWAFWATAVTTVKGYYFAYLRNNEQAGTFATWTIAERLIGAVLSVGLVVWAGWGVVGLIAGQMLGTLLVTVVVAVQIARAHPPCVSWTPLADSLTLGYPLLPRIVLSVVGSSADKYLLSHMATLGGVGIYSVGQRVANITFTYMTAVQNVFSPQVYSHMFSGSAGAGAAIGRYLTPFAYVSTLVSFLIAVFSEEILRIVAPTWEAAIAIVTILTLMYSLQFFGKMPQLQFARQSWLISGLAVVGVVVNTVCSALGIWWLGTVGAAWGTLAGAAIMIAISIVVGQRAFRIEWETRNLLAIFGLLFVSAFVTITLRELEVAYGVRLAVKIASAGAFAWLGVWLGLLTRENLRVVTQMVSSRFRRAPSPHAGA